VSLQRVELSRAWLSL